MFLLEYMNYSAIEHGPPVLQHRAALPKCTFHSSTGEHTHKWHATHARLVFVTSQACDDDSPNPGAKPDPNGTPTPKKERTRWRGLYMFEQGDDNIATQFRNLMVAHDRAESHPNERYSGLGQVIQDFVLSISVIRTQFFDEAYDHLRELVSPLTLLPYVQD